MFTLETDLIKWTRMEYAIFNIMVRKVVIFISGLYL